MHWPALKAAVEEFRSARGRTLEIATSVSEEQARARVRTGVWSVAEVLDHLVQTEVAFRKYLQQALDRARTGEGGTIRIGFREVDTRLRPLPGSWMPFLTPILFGWHAVVPFTLRLAVMRKPGLLWAAAPKVAEPLGIRTLEQLRTDLGAELRKTAALFEGDLPDTLPLIRAAHPLYGSNNAAQVMRLMAAHEERHQVQLRAILKAIAK